jgi:copper oxidase (laccase) domain-containing protein
LRLGPAEVPFTDTSDGDFRPSHRFDRDGAEVLRHDVTADFPWTWLRQVHGADVVVVDAPGQHAGAAADAAVAVVPGAPVSVLTADCAPVVLVDDAGVAVAVAHAGWRGLAAGVLAETVAAMRARGATSVRAVLGPTSSVRRCAARPRRAAPRSTWSPPSVRR